MPNERDKEFAASTTLFVNIYYYHMFQSILLLSSYFILKVVFHDEIFTFKWVEVQDEESQKVE